MKGLPADAVTHLLVQVAVALALAHLGGALLRRLGQPAVIGYVVAGVVLGPSVAGRLAPDLWNDLFPSADTGAGTGLLFALASLGAVLLLAIAGLDIDPAVVRERGRKLPGLAVGALLPAMLTGYGIGWLLPGSFVGEAASRSGFALLMAIALGISSPPVMAAILRDLQIAHRSFAHVALSIAMLTDVVGWVLLGVVVAGATGAHGAIAKALTGLVVLGALAVVAHLVIRRSGQALGDQARPMLALSLIAVLAAVSNGFGIEAVLGAFVAGIVLRGVGEGGAAVAADLRPLTTALFGPLFFVVAGLRVDLARLGSASVVAWTAALVIGATAAKVLGAGIPWRLAGRARSESLAMGAILNVRGSLEIVLAGVGLAAGVLTDTSYAAVILTALATSAIAAPIIRRAFGTDGLAARQAPVSSRR